MEEKTYHVLALSGGGYRGLYTATILAQLEDTLGQPIANHFDLICGTSAGGLLALGLASEIPAKDLRDMFLEKGEQIFGRKCGFERLFGSWFSAKHSNQGLLDVLTEKFGTNTIGDLKHRVMIPTVNFTKGVGQFFKTPHHPSFQIDHTIPIVNVGMATTAAPTYFPMFKDDRGTFVDGGLVANAPGFFGLHEVRHFIAEDQSVKVRVLAIGTISVGSLISSAGNPDMGIVQWGKNLFDLVISVQEGSTDNLLRHYLKDDYLRIDDVPSPGQTRDVRGLDVVSKKSTEVLVQKGMAAVQAAIGSSQFTPFKNHIATSPKFFHGPNKNA